jgi:hypothetical protein
MRRATVAKPCAFRQQKVEPEAFAPFEAIVDVAYKIMVGTKVSRKPNPDRDSKRFVNLVVVGIKAVEFYNSYFFIIDQ